MKQTVCKYAIIVVLRCMYVFAAVLPMTDRLMDISRKMRCVILMALLR
jgi:hypothetical protein